MSSFEKSVKGATKIKAAPPKTKYIEHILVATHSGEAGVGEVFRALQHRLRDSTWTVVFKSLITVHLMIREGEPDTTLAYLAKHRNMLAISSFTDAQTQGRNIRHYANYLSERARAYRDTKTDWVRANESRLEKLTVDKGLLRETETVQHQLTALLKCDVMDNEPENEITITVFRLLVGDLLALFQVLNQAMINILGHFFEMSKVDAERAMEIYRTFTKQTDFVVQYLSVARQYEHHTRVEVPKLKHAPVNLGRQLEEYLNDPDFEVHRRQYLAELEVKKSGKGGLSSASKPSASSSAPIKSVASNNPFPSTNGSSSTAKPAAARGPDPDLIDFFDSIEQNQTTVQVAPAPAPAPVAMAGGMPFATNSPFAIPQATGYPNGGGFVTQPTGFVANSPFQTQPQQQPGMTPFGQPQQLNPAFTGAGFGAYTPQPSFQPSALAPIPQDTVATFQTGATPGMQSMQTGQITNPFRASMLLNQQTGMAALQTGGLGSAPQPAVVSPSSPKSTNPFARSSQAFSPATTATNSPFQTQTVSPLQPTPTGTNPFARNFVSSAQQPAPQPAQQPTAPQGLVPQPTGSTNPFRQGAFVNHATGMGWQHNQTTIGGGLDQVGTIPVFPRPAQQTPWQQ